MGMRSVLVFVGLWGTIRRRSACGDDINSSFDVVVSRRFELANTQLSIASVWMSYRPL